VTQKKGSHFQLQGNVTRSKFSIFSAVLLVFEAFKNIDF